MTANVQEKKNQNTQQVKNERFYISILVCFDLKMVTFYYSEIGGWLGVKSQLSVYSEIDTYLVFYAQSTSNGHIGAKQNVFLPQVKIVIHYSTHIPQLMTEDI